VVLYINEAKVSAEVAAYLHACGVRVAPYEAFLQDLDRRSQHTAIMADDCTTSHAVVR
jgi:superfamily II DNA helicase RecQ